MPHLINKTDSMADILIITPQGAYNRKVHKVEEYTNCYRDSSTRVIEFAYNTVAASVVEEMGIKKRTVDLIQRLLSSNVC